MTDLKTHCGIYVRIGFPCSEVQWLDGYQVIDLAYQEAAETGDSISEILLTRNNVTNLSNPLYNEYGVYLGGVELRSITVKEAVRFLGRFLQICHFLTNREEALRFVKLLEEGNDTEEINAAKEVRLMIPLLPERVPHLSKTTKRQVYRPHFAGTETVSRF
ncbi:MAG: hypothetical protein LBJ67_11290 [Planctomycetaceae bacterium]|jgi:hypothetical protein|nr:hypothetical protein [Planctomycetaceae bacterium]